MNARGKRGLVHFGRRVSRRHAAVQKWTCPLFPLPASKNAKGDRSTFPRRSQAGLSGTGKNGPVPFCGFTLLEIILALGILAGSLAALGEVMRLADQNAAGTRDETQAQILASSVIDELIAGVLPLSAVNQAPFSVKSEPPWGYSIALEQTGYEELIAVRVLVEQQTDARLQPARFELVRWLPNPDYIPASTGGQSSSGSASGSSSGSSGSQTGAGGQR